MDAGADPTVQPYRWIASILEFTDDPSPPASLFNQVIELYLISKKGTLVLHKMLTTSSHFELANSKDYAGNTALLKTCSLRFRSYPDQPFRSAEIIGKIKTLIDSGFNILESNDSGQTCLHLLFYHQTTPCGDILKDLLRLFIDKGADVYAIDKFGRSVSNVAYSDICRTAGEDQSSYRGDLWDAVLDAYGFNILEFRTEYPRNARYTNNYSRKDFELLWKDREHRCPYWDDRDWPYFGNNQSKEHMSRFPELICGCPHSRFDLIEPDHESNSELDLGLTSSDLGYDSDNEENELSTRTEQLFEVSARDSYESTVTPDHGSFSDHNDAEQTQQELDGQDFNHTIPSSWRLMDVADMLWNSAPLGSESLDDSFQLNTEAVHNELFYSPWAEN